MRHFADTFTLAPDVAAVAQRLLAEDGFAHLHRARIGCLFSARVILDRGAVCRALVVVPAQISSKQIERVFHEWAMAQLLVPVFHGDLPDFVVFVDLAQWTAASALEQEQLVFHELSHIVQKRSSYDVPVFDHDGRPALRLAPHDAELFYAEVTRYGRIVPSFDDTAVAIAEGAHAHGPRQLKRA